VTDPRAEIIQVIEDYGIPTTGTDFIDWEGLADSVVAVATRDLKAKQARALLVAQDHGQTDGSHHKTWVIDQMVRALTGREYELWVLHYQVDPDGAGAEWDTGIAP
jgi:hypothetical protein